MKAIYSEETAVQLNRSSIVSILVENDTLHVTSDILESILFLKDQTSLASRFRVYGSHFQEVSGLVLKTQIWDKGKYREIQKDNFDRKWEEDEGVFYDDDYFFSLDIPAASTDNITSWSYHEWFRDPRFLPGFLFYSSFPQIETSYIIRTTPGVELEWRLLNNKENNIIFRKYEQNGLTYYEWRGSNLEALGYEQDSPRINHFIPQVMCYIKSFKTTKGQQSLLTGLDDLNRWYWTTVEGLLSQKPNEEIHRIVHSIIRTGDQPWDIVRKVYYWVQQNIRYIAFEDGMRGIIPHSPEYVLEKRYGDCKDMASLIVGMLRASGIHQVYYTWIGTRDLPYAYTELPTPAVDNHMIATYVDENNKFHFLDGTSNYTPGGFPSWMIQGKEALVVLGPDRYVIAKVPEVDPGQSQFKDSVVLEISGNSLVGSGKMHLTGYCKVDASYDVDKGKLDELERNVVSWVGKGNNKFFLQDYKIGGLHEPDAPLEIDYTFKVSDYCNSLDGELFVNLNLHKPFYNSTLPESRKHPRKFEYKFENNDVCVLKIPAGYKAEYIPADIIQEGTLLGFRRKYEVKGNSVILRSRVYTNVLMLRPEQFEEWNEAVRKLSETYRETIVLKKE